MDRHITDFFVLRTPLYKFNKLVGTAAELLEQYKITIVREALSTASKDLYEALCLLETQGLTNGEFYNKTIASLYKYYTRLCTRCTPFGLFAGISIGVFADANQVSFVETPNYVFRLDMDYLCNLYYEISKDTAMFDRLLFYSNNSLYKLAGQWRYVEYKFKNGYRFHDLTTVSDNEVLSLILEKGRKGIHYKEIIPLITDYGFEEEEAIGYIHELINNQLLVSELYPSVTGEAYQFRLFNSLKRIAPQKYAQSIDVIVDQLQLSEPSATGIMRSLDLALKDFGIKVQDNKLLQFDMMKRTTVCSIKSSQNEYIKKTSFFLANLMTGTRNTRLENFKTAFYERYENAFMPLALVMDTDIGVGYKNAVAGSANLPYGYIAENDKVIKKFKFDLFKKAYRDNLKIIEITEDDFKHSGLVLGKNMPDSYVVMVTPFLAGEDIYMRYKSGGGPSLINLSARFSHLSREVETMICKLAELEEENYQNVILAEVLHLPQGRLGNVVTRPQVRQYEIPYLAQSLLPEENQIQVDDLYIGVVNSRLILYSHKLKKEVMPRLSNAHNFRADSLPVYEFLCELQAQDIVSNFYWSWDELYTEEFLPRVLYCGVIVSPARWNISGDRFKAARNKNQLSIEMIGEVAVYYSLPMQFLVVKGDNELFIDLGSELGRAAFFNEFKKNDQLVIEESLYDHDKLVDGYTAEMIIPFHTKRDKPYSGIAPMLEPSTLHRSYSPFSEWLFIKIFTGRKFSESLLTTVVPQIVESAFGKQLIKKWFFIRYADPKHHIRIRFLLSDKAQKQAILDLIELHIEQFVQQQLIWDLQIATYNPEVARYGVDSIEDCETWFYHNSNLVLKLLPIFSTLLDKEKELFTIYLVDKILEYFGLNKEHKLDFVARNSDLFNREFGIEINKQLRFELNSAYREAHRDMDLLLNFNTPPEKLVDSFALIERFNAMFLAETDEAVKQIIQKNSRGRYYYVEILASLLHMFINRLYYTKQRFFEMKVYYFLNKLYKSEIAKNKHEKK